MNISFMYNFEKDKEANNMETTKLEKITISVGTGRVKDDKRKMELIQDRLSKITGQKSIPVLSKKSIASFKLRKGETAGFKVTLRGERMSDFLDKFITLSIPRTRDFRGIPIKSIDEMGNLTVGIKENIIFLETSDEELNDIFGLSVTLVTNTKNREEAEFFLKKTGIPFKKQ